MRARQADRSPTTSFTDRHARDLESLAAVRAFVDRSCPPIDGVGVVQCAPAPAPTPTDNKNAAQHSPHRNKHIGRRRGWSARSVPLCVCVCACVRAEGMRTYYAKSSRSRVVGVGRRGEREVVWSGEDSARCQAAPPPMDRRHSLVPYTVQYGARHSR